MIQAAEDYVCELVVLKVRQGIPRPQGAKGKGLKDLPRFISSSLIPVPSRAAQLPENVLVFLSPLSSLSVLSVVGKILF